MSTAAAALSNPPMGRSMSHTATIYLKEAKYEFLKNLRLRVYTASVISFPLMFYVLFGLVLNSREAIGGTGVPTYLIATYGTFGVMGASLFGTAAGLASDRGLGWLQLKRASPMPPFAYFAAKVVMSMIFSGIVVALLMVLGISFGGVRLPLSQMAKLLGTLVAGSLLRHGVGHRLLCRTELGASDHQLDLSSNVFLQRAVGAVYVSPQDRTADRACAASLSLIATCVRNRRRGTARVSGNALGSTAGIHADLSGRGPHWFSTRSGKAVRVKCPNKVERIRVRVQEQRLGLSPARCGAQGRSRV